MREETAQIISNAVAVAATLVLPRLLVLLQLSLPYIVRSIRRKLQFVRARPKREPGRLTSHVLETFQDANSIGSTAGRLIHSHLGMDHIELDARKSGIFARCRRIYSNLQQDAWGFTIICLLLLGLGVFYVSIQAAAILTARIISSSFGISGLPTCGWWLPASAWEIGRRSNTTGVSIEGDSRTTTYAEMQYNPVAFQRSLSNYAKQKVDYEVYRDRYCPFASKYCVQDNATLTLDTGMQSFRVLGVNTAQELFFQKKVTCTPLKTRLLGGFNISVSGSSGTYHNELEHIYGARMGDSYDYMQIMKDENCNGSGYLLR